MEEFKKTKKKRSSDIHSIRIKEEHINFIESNNLKKSELIRYLLDKFIKEQEIK